MLYVVVTKIISRYGTRLCNNNHLTYIILNVRARERNDVNAVKKFIVFKTQLEFVTRCWGR